MNINNTQMKNEDFNDQKYIAKRNSIMALKYGLIGPNKYPFNSSRFSNRSSENNNLQVR